MRTSTAPAAYAVTAVAASRQRRRDSVEARLPRPRRWSSSPPRPPIPADAGSPPLPPAPPSGLSRIPAALLPLPARLSHRRSRRHHCCCRWFRLAATTGARLPLLPALPEAVSGAASIVLPAGAVAARTAAAVASTWYAAVCAAITETAPPWPLEPGLAVEPGAWCRICRCRHRAADRRSSALPPPPSPLPPEPPLPSDPPRRQRRRRCRRCHRSRSTTIQSPLTQPRFTASPQAYMPQKDPARRRDACSRCPSCHRRQELHAPGSPPSFTLTAVGVLTVPGAPPPLSPRVPRPCRCLRPASGYRRQCEEHQQLT